MTPETQTLYDWCKQRDACENGLVFVSSCASPAEFWSTCERGDWMIWIIERMPATVECDRLSRLIACDCAESVLLIYEKFRPGDTRVRDCIATARRYADGAATAVELDAARSAADAAGSAARSAADAARSAAWSAARSAADAAWSAARSAADAARSAAWSAADAAWSAAESAADAAWSAAESAADAAWSAAQSAAQSAAWGAQADIVRHHFPCIPWEEGVKVE